MTAEQSTPAESKKPNYLLWGCLIFIVLGCLTIGCLFTFFGLTVFSDFDPLGLDIQNRIEEIINWDDFIEDPYFDPNIDEVFPEDSSDYEVPDPESIEPVPYTGTMPMLPYTAVDFTASFSYPADWVIEEEEYRITFYQPDSYTYLYVGEDLVDEGSTAAEVADDVLASVMEDAAEDTFELLESGPYLLASGHDAYLNAFQFVDTEGFYYWAYDLEIIDGESNIFFFLEGDNPEEYEIYRAILDEIAASFTR